MILRWWVIYTELLLDRRGADVQVTEKVVKAAVGNRRSGKEMTAILAATSLRSRGRPTDMAAIRDQVSYYWSTGVERYERGSSELVKFSLGDTLKSLDCCQRTEQTFPLETRRAVVSCEAVKMVTKRLSCYSWITRRMSTPRKKMV